MVTGYREILAANTSAYAGYSLGVALEAIARLGYKRVEIASMEGLVEHVTASELNPRGAARVSRLLKDHGLSSAAFSGHLFLNKPNAVEAFLPRMEFARGIGARIINTKAGSPNYIDVFYRNMELLVRRAEQLDIIIGLETHGDIVDYGQSAVEAIKYFASPWVTLNYDFGSVVINSGGQVDPIADFEGVFTEVGHLHLKDAVLSGKWWDWKPIGYGAVDYPRLFAFLGRQNRVLPMTVDLPLGLRLSIEAEVKVLQQPLSIGDINRIMNLSLEFVNPGGVDSRE